MKFGRVEVLDGIDFRLPAQDEASQTQSQELPKIHIGFTGFSAFSLKAADKKAGMRHALAKYNQYFDCIELNASYYRTPSVEQIELWDQVTTDDFAFIPKVHKLVSQSAQIDRQIEQYRASFNTFQILGKKYRGQLLQLPEYRRPGDWQSIQSFLELLPNNDAVHLELRHEDWYDEHQIVDVYKQYIWAKALDSSSNSYLCITDSPGRRDIIPRAIKGPELLIRFATTGERLIDESRLQDWYLVLAHWRITGLRRCYLILHNHNVQYAIALKDYARDIGRQYD